MSWCYNRAISGGQGVSIVLTVDVMGTSVGEAEPNKPGFNGLVKINLSLTKAYWEVGMIRI